MIISSQKFIDDEIVADKIDSEDYTIYVSPEFTIDGETYCVLMDGHHSLAAAKQAGVTPEIVEYDARDADTIGLLDIDIHTFLESSYIDSDWYDIETGVTVW